MSFKRSTTATAALLWLAIWLFAAIGWVWNVIKIVNTFDASSISGEIVVRIIGVFVMPIGAIYGWF
jgi:hypothetical protein